MAAAVAGVVGVAPAETPGDGPAPKRAKLDDVSEKIVRQVEVSPLLHTLFRLEPFTTFANLTPHMNMQGIVV